MPFISFWNLLTKQFFFIWKRTQLNKRKSWLHPLKDLFVYLYRDRVDITVPEHVGKHFISDHGSFLMNVCFNCCESDGEV